MHRVAAAILAGGEGKRFKPFTDMIPKPMIPVGVDERPLLEYIVSWLARKGVRDIVLLVGYRWRQVYNYFNRGERWGVRILYSRDDETYGDTGGALLKAYVEGKLRGTALVWYGDILAPIRVEELLDQHFSTGADATLVVAEKYRVPVGVARISGEGDVEELREKPELPLKVTVGVLVINTAVLEEAGEELGTRFDLMAHLVPWMIGRGARVKAYIHRGPWYDVGSLERYAKLDHREISEFLTPLGREAETPAAE